MNKTEVCVSSYVNMTGILPHPLTDFSQKQNLTPYFVSIIMQTPLLEPISLSLRKNNAENNKTSMCLMKCM